MSIAETILLSVTVAKHVAVFEPSCVVPVIVAEPAATPVTTPVEITVATDVLLELQLTVAFVALDGSTVAVNWVVAPTYTETESGDTLTPVTAISPTTTVKGEDVVLSQQLSVATAVIVYVPSATLLHV